MAGAVKEKAAIEVAVPGNAEIRLFRHNAIRRSSAILNQQRIRHTIGEVTVWLMVHLDELEGEMGLQCIHHTPGTPVTRGAHNLQRLERTHIHVGQQVLDIGCLGADRRKLPR